MLAQDLGDCRDSMRNLQSMFLMLFDNRRCDRTYRVPDHRRSCYRWSDAISRIWSNFDEERKEEKDYITLMDEIIDNYKKELYKK